MNVKIKSTFFDWRFSGLEPPRRPKRSLIKRWWNKKLAAVGITSPPVRSCYGISKQFAPPSRCA